MQPLRQAGIGQARALSGPDQDASAPRRRGRFQIAQIVSDHHRVLGGDLESRQRFQQHSRAGLASLLGQPPEQFAMPVDLWVHLVYEFAAAYHHRNLPREHLLKSLTPLYLGRTASWVVQAAPYGAHEVETELDALSARFEALKPHLRVRWNERR